MKMKLKICGMRELDNIKTIASLCPDYLGFIFYKESKRFVGDDFAIPKDMTLSVKRIGVFVNESTDEMLNLVKRHGLNLVQLHGTESIGQCNELKRNGVGVIKAFSIDNQFDWNFVDEYAQSIDYALFDTKGSGFGGTGTTFDWALLENCKAGVPFFLSGGLSLDNIHKAMAIQHKDFYAIDVNSGLELVPGVKDIEKVKSFKGILNAKFNL